MHSGTALFCYCVHNTVFISDLEQTQVGFHAILCMDASFIYLFIYFILVIVCSVDRYVLFTEVSHSQHTNLYGSMEIKIYLKNFTSTKQQNQLTTWSLEYTRISLKNGLQEFWNILLLVNRWFCASIMILKFSEIKRHTVSLC